MKLHTTVLCCAALASAFTSQDALPGFLHTNASVRMDPGELHASFYSWTAFDENDRFQNDRVLIGSDTVPVDYLLQADNMLALAMGIPGGFALSATLPVYYEQVRFLANDHEGVYLGDVFLKAAWTTHASRRLPWLKGLLAVSTNLGTSTTGQGYLVRELEYAYSEEGCYLYSCGSRHTGLQFSNVELRYGASADLSRTRWKRPAQLHVNFFYRATGFTNPDVGVYQASNVDVYNILGFTIAGEYHWRRHWTALVEYRHEQRYQSDYAIGADLHQMHYGIAWKNESGVSLLAGVAHGILNDDYAQTMFATSTGQKVARYGFKTPDFQMFAAASYEIGQKQDRDHDGVEDAHDQCPQTRLGAPVDINGCAWQDMHDADQDGVTDSLDQCPQTPEDVLVDSRGCPQDADHDGIPDYHDRCPNTAKGVKVDRSGCPMDSDEDGVPESKDMCPNTLKSISVDAQGCPIREEQDLGKLQRQINFEVGSDKIAKSSFPVLDNLAALLLKIPDVHIEVQGHTDSDGKPEYNLDLSQRRAESVVKYLITKGIAAERLVAKGYGITKPIADNRTLSGKRLNRRVELIPIQ